MDLLKRKIPSSSRVSSQSGDSSSEVDLGHTRNDASDMHRMGKEQQLHRNFRQFASISLTCICMSTWEVIFIANTQGLNCGGLAGLLWSYVWTFAGFGTIIASLAEMASMAPSAGGQYHWVSEFAPRRCQKFLSYLTGWMSTLSWQACNASGPFLEGTIIQALITVNNPNYEGTGWQGTLFIFAFTVPMWLGNTVFSSGLPTFNSIIMILHVSGFIVIIGVLWGLAPHNSAEDVFTHFTNGGGWSSNPLAIMVGQISAIWALICSDSAVHMGEETSSASLTVPRSMFYAYLSNGLIAFVFLITYLFAIPSVTDAVNDPSGYPFLYVLQHTFPDKVAGTNVITTIMLVLNLAASIVFNASTARQMFAFARDKGLPFSNWIAHVHPTWKIPVHAVTLTCATACLLGLINIGSSAAFNAIISLNLTSLLLTYILAIASVMYRRIVTPHLIPPARWSLGRYAVVVNGVALVYSVFAFFWCFWPNVVDPDPEDFNWAVAIFAAVFVWAVAMYFFRGRKVYDGPVTLVKAAPEAEVVFETKNKSEADVIPEEKNENFGIASFDVGHS